MNIFKSKKRRPAKHLRKTPKGFTTVNPDISYDHVTGLQIDRKSNAYIKDGLMQEAEGAMQELEQVVVRGEVERQKVIERMEDKRRQELEVELNHLVTMQTKCNSEAAENAAALFEMKATAHLDLESLNVEYIGPDAYDMGPNESPYSDVSMRGYVLLGSGDDKIKVDVFATSTEEEDGSATTTRYSYSYNKTQVSDPQSLYEAVKKK